MVLEITLILAQHFVQALDFRRVMVFEFVRYRALGRVWVMIGGKIIDGGLRAGQGWVTSE